MLEGEGTVPTSSGSADAASAASGTAGGSSGTQAAQGSGGAGSLASAGDGSAPVPGADASLAGVAAPAEPAVAPPSTFRFANREFKDLKAAEDFFRSQVGRVPDTQRKIAEYERKIAEQDQTVQALQRALATGQPTQPGQGAANGSAAPDGSQGFAEKLVKSGDLEFITSLLQDPDPNVGIQRFTVALADRMDREMNERMERLRSEQIEPIVRQTQFERHMGTALSVARNLGQEFPELDNSNLSPEAVEHQQAFVDTLKQFPPDFVQSNPQLAMLATALLTRYQHGTPVVAQMPGTSGSPSDRATQASEQALSQATGSPISGTGTPRPRPNGQPESDLERVRRENAAAPGNFKSPTGRDLGFGPA